MTMPTTAPTEIRLPAHDASAERALLGSMLRDPSIIAEAITLIRPDQYYTHAHAVIHRTIAAMRADGQSVDLVTVGSRLLDDHQEAEIGGLAYLGTLYDSAPCAGHYREYAAAICSAAIRRHAERAAGDPASTIVGVITAYLARRYRPIFRRAAAIWSDALSREVARAEACAAPTSDLIPALLAATDYPRDQDGPRRTAIPTVYRQWAPIAWQDLLTGLPDEADSPEIGDAAGEQFRRGVAELMSHIESLAYQPTGKEHAQVQRRSLIDWCRLFARPGPWRSIRSLAIWCRLDAGTLAVAYHHRLYSQVGRRHLAPSSHRALVQLCVMYGVGEGTRTSRSAMVELAPEYIAELLTGPCDGECDGDGDAASTRARARTTDASHTPSHTPPHGCGDVSAIPSDLPSPDGK